MVFGFMGIKMVAISGETLKTVCAHNKIGTRFVEEFLMTQLGFYREKVEPGVQSKRQKEVKTDVKDELIWDATVFHGFEKVSFNSFSIHKVIHDDSPGFKTRFTPMIVKAIVEVLPKEFVTSVVNQKGQFKTLVVTIPKKETK